LAWLRIWPTVDTQELELIYGFEEVCRPLKTKVDRYIIHGIHILCRHRVLCPTYTAFKEQPQIRCAMQIDIERNTKRFIPSAVL